VPSLRYVIVDVFTDTALAGNQLAVFTDAREIDERLMQALTKEIGFSESAFLLPAEAGGQARLRIFNTRQEMPFAGHPILGAAWVLAQPLQRGVVELETGMGIVPVELDRDESGALVFGRM
jgi:trans-2,3-dihydro-3-hydroxyanthranilate isomerase